MKTPKKVFDVDSARESWDLGAVRYLLSHHAKDRLIQMAGQGAVGIVGHVLVNGRRVEPPSNSKYANESEWITLGDLTLAVESRGRRRNIITALFSTDDAWQRHLAKKPTADRQLRQGFMARRNLDKVLHPAPQAI